MLQCLGYISRCQMVASDRGMHELLDQCRLNNHEHKLTGVLLYNDATQNRLPYFRLQDGYTIWLQIVLLQLQAQGTHKRRPAHLQL